MRPKVLILGSSLSEYPIAHVYARLGFEVCTMGSSLKGAVSICDFNYFDLDYTDNEQLLSLIQREHFDLVVPGCNDLALEHAIQNSAGLYAGVRYANFTLAHDKRNFYSLCDSLEIKVPAWSAAESLFANFEDHELTRRWSGRYLVKPRRATGGKGILVVEEARDLRLILRNLQRDNKINEYVVQKFIHGSHHGLSLMFKGGELIGSFIDEEIASPRSLSVAATFHPAASLSARAQNRVVEEACKLARAVGTEAYFHIQFIFDGEDHFFIDPSLRLAGDLHGLTLKSMTGIDPYALVAASESKNVSGSLGRREKVIQQPKFSGSLRIVKPLDNKLEELSTLIDQGRYAKRKSVLSIGKDTVLLYDMEANDMESVISLIVRSGRNSVTRNTSSFHKYQMKQPPGSNV